MREQLAFLEDLYAALMNTRLGLHTVTRPL